MLKSEGSSLGPGLGAMSLKHNIASQWTEYLSVNGGWKSKATGIPETLRRQTAELLAYQSTKQLGVSGWSLERH